MSELRIVCPRCHVTNTLPDQRLGGGEVARHSDALMAGDIVRWGRSRNWLRTPETP